jgi:ribonuclease HII
VAADAPDVWRLERETAAAGYDAIAGVDEVGRGPLAGPVVSAAVILPPAFGGSGKKLGITDSKKISPKKRQLLYDTIYFEAHSVGIGIVDVKEIDRRNILQAALSSMAIAVANLLPQPDFLLIDGKFPIHSPLPQKAVIKGDRLSLSIAAASIIAKVTRDRLMIHYDKEYPTYGFARHKGYPTKAHLAAVRQHGRCPIHRCSFRGVPSQLPLFTCNAS